MRRAGWELPALLVLLAATAAGYLVNLGVTGDGNSFYAAAVQAGTRNWTAFFFGSLDPANFVTVDKPPASLWVMELSGRLFGFGTWSMLVPQVLMAVAAVAALHATVRRVAGPVPALLAGVLLALTPVVVLMFRFNNPDALLTLLLTVAGYTTVRAVQTASTRWLLLTGLVVGVAFLTKELQAFLAVPGLALAYLWAAPTGAGRRILQLLAAGGAIVVGAGWWILAAALWPAADRPYIGGSADNSELGRALGYNGLSRVLGGGPGPAGGGAVRNAGAFAARADLGHRGSGGFLGLPGFLGFGSRPGLTRMFGSEVAGQIAWLLPAALALLVAGLWLTRRAPRTDLTRAALLLFGGWLVAGGLVLSLMQGIFHSYYTLVLAPPLAALAAIGGSVVWRVRDREPARWLLAAVLAGTAAWSWLILMRTPSFAPGLAWFVLVAGLGVAGALLVAGRTRRTAAVLIAAAVLVGVAGPAAYAVDTVTAAHGGAFASAGPAVGGAEVASFRRLAARLADLPGFQDARVSVPPGGDPGRTASGSDATLDALLRSAGTRWSAATTGSSAAATLELASGTAVMGIGGFIGSDPAPTPAQFQADVRSGEVHYFVAGGGFAFLGGRSGVGAEITAWVQQHFRATNVGGRTVYDLLPREAASA